MDPPVPTCFIPPGDADWMCHQCRYKTDQFYTHTTSRVPWIALHMHSGG
jgi:hypothetical protein